jgi:hypothetical protein
VGRLLARACRGREPGHAAAPHRVRGAHARARRRLLAGRHRGRLSRRRPTRAAAAVHGGLLRLVPARPQRQQRRGRPLPVDADGRRDRSPVDPRRRPRGLEALLRDDRPARGLPRRRLDAGPRAVPGCQGRLVLSAVRGPNGAPAHGVRRDPRRQRGRLPPRGHGGGLPRQRRPGRATRLPPGLLLRVRPRP